MATKIQMRRDTAANWKKANPILMEGEMGIVLDDPKQYKVGDGVKAWNDLPLRGYDGTIAHETGDSETAVMSQKAVTDLTNEYNVSVLYPTGGTDGTDRYTLDSAIAKIPVALQKVGIKCSFIDADGFMESWEYYRSGSFTNIYNWRQTGSLAEFKIQKNQLLYKKAVFGKNLFNKDGNFLVGKYITRIDGNTVIYGGNELYAVSDFIPVEGGQSYVGNGIVEGGAYSVFYDKNFVPLETFKTDTGVCVAPENAAWARLSCVYSQINGAIFQKGTELITFSDYEKFYDSFDVEELRRNVNERHSAFLFSAIKGKFIERDGNIGDNDLYAASDYIGFDKRTGLSYKLFTSRNRYVCCIAFYDREKNFINGYVGEDQALEEAQEHTLAAGDIPDKAVYFRVTLNLAAFRGQLKYENYVIYATRQDYLEDDIQRSRDLFGVNNVTKYFNAFDYNDPDYKEDCFINADGTETTNQYSSAYAVTGYIRVPDVFQAVYINYEVGNVYAALYDKDKKFIKASAYLQDGVRSIDFADGCYYVRFTTHVSKKERTVIAFTEIPEDIPYTPYGKVYALDEQTDEYIGEKIADAATLFTPKYDNKYSSSLSTSGELVLDNIPDSKNYYGIGCSFNITTMGTVKIYKSQNDYCRGEIDIDATNITEYKSSSETNVIPHGLIITDSLVVSIVKGTTTNITLTNTAGEEVSIPLPNWVGCRGGEIKFIAVSGEYNNIVLSHSGTWMDKDTWIFGDSYTDFWPSKAYGNGNDNFYLDGYSGRGSQDGYSSLERALKYGTPKRIVWMLGMNNADTESAVNSSWNSVFDQLKTLCSNKHVQLIPCTIPNVPDRIHTFKNDIIRSSGLPYIDIASALGANEAGATWYPGLLGSDNVHPTGTGAEIIANVLAAGVPDICL